VVINEKKAGQAIRTERLRTSCVELFITNRYLSSSSTIYNQTENYLDELNTINGQLMIWESHANGTEVWFLKQVKLWRTDFKAFLKIIESETMNFKERL